MAKKKENKKSKKGSARTKASARKIKEVRAARTPARKRAAAKTGDRGGTGK